MNSCGDRVSGWAGSKTPQSLPAHMPATWSHAIPATLSPAPPAPCLPTPAPLPQPFPACHLLPLKLFAILLLLPALKLRHVKLLILLG